MEAVRSFAARIGPSLREAGRRYAPPVRGEEGFALVVTIIVLVLMASLVAAAITTSMSSMRSTSADYRNARAFYAAEAAAEAIMADVEVALQDGNISDDEIAAIFPPPITGFDFTGFKVEKVDTVRIETVADGGYAGLYSLTQDIRITVPATDPAGNHNRVVLGVKAQAIPIFQFGVFFEEDLEIHPSPPMNFYGRAHSNGNIYLSSDNVWFWEPVTTPNEVIWGYKVDVSVSFPNRKNGVYIADASGNAVQLDFDSRDTPDPDQFKAKSNASFDDRLQTNAYGLDSLRLPLPASVPPREIVRPKEPGDSDIEKATKFAWLADMYVTVDLSNQQGKSGVCGGGAGGGLHPTITVDRPFGGVVPTDSDKCQMFDWNWERFFDSRDSMWVDVLDLDIAYLKAWGPPGVGDVPSIIYVEFINGSVTNSSTDPSGDGQYFPILRLKNGSELPGPLTIATEHPIYVWGDYNTINKKPAAIAGDSYSVLSNKANSCPNGGGQGTPGWCDEDHQVYRRGNDPSDGIPDRTYPTRTEIWTAILAGAFPSLCDYMTDPGCTAFWADLFGGALENYPRLQENWQNIELMYRGSIIALWTPVYSLYLNSSGATTWNCCSTSYYRPPIRNWGFDIDLLDPAKLPPGTPVVGAVLRTSFREGY